MPIYCFVCECGARAEDVRTMESRNMPMPCPSCYREMDRDTVAEQTTTTMKEFHTPIEMHSIAPTNQAEHDQLVRAGAEMTREGVPVARSRHEKMRLLKLVGFVEKN
ncbi:MAG: hypothetical protein NTW96_27545 [Planctomycetia bacterium]|nr:hypothetical protein [Planctomycetia bacterium]